MSAVFPGERGKKGPDLGELLGDEEYSEGVIRAGERGGTGDREEGRDMEGRSSMVEEPSGC